MTRKIVIERLSSDVFEATVYQRNFLFWSKVRVVQLPLPYCQQLLDLQNELDIKDEFVQIRLAGIKFSLK